MRVLVATDTWHPHINGVVHTLGELARSAPSFGATIAFLTPEGLPSLPMPTYPGLRLPIARPQTIARQIVEQRPAAIHIATEGPIGLLVRQYCRANGLAFTTSFHTRFPEYLAARTPIPQSWTWAALRWFHRAAGGVMAGTPALEAELVSRGFDNVMAWPRGVDAALFQPRPGADLGLPRLVFLTVGRLAVEKNIEAFLALDLPGSKVVVGDGPARADLKCRFPDAVFLGIRRGEELARAYAAADVFVFPSRTDTYGLVLLEALASGTPVAAFPVCGPRDVVGDAPVAALDEDLRAACLKALTLSREQCRAFALERSWDTSARIFLANVRRVAMSAAVAAEETSEAMA
jgi:glycosyltransferase involved in cell wall biosynthesis